jgi:hypothetical protein
MNRHSVYHNHVIVLLKFVLYLFKLVLMKWVPISLEDIYD